MFTVTVTNDSDIVIFKGRPTGDEADVLRILQSEGQPTRLECNIPSLIASLEEEPKQQLPPFSGDNPVCPKCGYGGDGNPSAYTVYMALGVCDHATGYVMQTAEGGFNERLHRSCGRCQYAWDEAVAK